MWTLRDLFMMLSPQYAQHYREQAAMDYGNRTYGRDDSTPYSLEDYYSQKAPAFKQYMDMSRPNIYYNPDTYLGNAGLGYDLRKQSPKGMT